jgi:hypothetical protein
VDSRVANDSGRSQETGGGKWGRRETDKAETIKNMIVDGTLSERRRGQRIRGDEQGPTTWGQRPTTRGDGTPPATTATRDNRPVEATTEPDGLTDDRYNENADPKLDDRPPADR